MKSRLGALCLSAVCAQAWAQPAPPDLRTLPAPAPAASAPGVAASEPPKRRCVAGCDGQSARVSWSEDALNRFEEHRDEQGRLLRYFVHPKSGMPKYEVLLGAHRQSQPGTGSFRTPSDGNTEGASPRVNQSVWELKKF